MYEKFNRVPTDIVEAGDICAVCGIDDIQVGSKSHVALILINSL